MTATAFDTHKIAKTLAKAGFPEPQVEAQVDVLTEFSSDLATKKDLEQLRLATKKDLQILEKDLVNTITMRMLAIGAFMLGIAKLMQLI